MGKNANRAHALSEASLEELMAELTRRQGRQLTDRLECLDRACHEAGLAFGLAAYQAALDFLTDKQDGLPKPCPGCGKECPVRSHDRAREVWCVDGVASLRRHYYHCSECGRGFYPLDTELGLPARGRLSRELERRLADFAVTDSFAEGAERFSLHYNLRVSEKLVRDVADRVGENLAASHKAAVDYCVEPPPPEKRGEDNMLIVQTDGCMLPMRGRDSWKEAKLGTLFSSQQHLARGGPGGERGVIAQTRYVGVLGRQDEFRSRLDIALRMENSGNGSAVVWIADGAKGNWRLAEELAPECIQILDWYHAMEHASDCGKAIFGEDSPWVAVWRDQIAGRLMADQVDVVIVELKEAKDLARGQARKALGDLERYYESNAERMLYGTYRQRRLPIGSGKVESSHRHTLQRRMKNAGQHWSVERARRMVQMRCLYQSVGPDRFYDTVADALRLTNAGEVPEVGWQKNRASNRG